MELYHGTTDIAVINWSTDEYNNVKCDVGKGQSGKLYIFSTSIDTITNEWDPDYYVPTGKAKEAALEQVKLRE